MNESLIEGRSRREFLRRLGRQAALAVIAIATVAVVATRARGRDPAVCVKRGICGGCAVFAGCELPPARAVRSARTGG